MFIQSLNLLNSKSYPNIASNKNSKPSFRSKLVMQDTFIRADKSLVTSALSKLKKLTLEEYKLLNKDEILALRAEISAIKIF